MRRMLGFPTDSDISWRVAYIQYSTLGLSNIVSVSRRTFAEFSFPCHHRRSGGTAARFFHAVDQKGIQTPEEMVGPRDEAESERGKVMGINLFSGYGYVYAIVYHRLKDIRI